jgi:hypothetical protein
MKKFTSIIFTILLLQIYSCNGTIPNKTKENQKKTGGQFPVDTLADETAKFLIGMQTVRFSDLQKSPKYQVHKNQMESGFKNFTKPTLTKISAWISDKKELTDSTVKCLFYPFSGPDFLYAHTFFPDKEKYIMLGLEKIGKLPDIRKLPDSLLYGYLANLRISMQYINTNGYFVTSQMSRFFKNQNLDGIVHLISCYLSVTSHTISRMRYIVLDLDGNISEDFKFSDTDKQTKGIEIQFFNKDENKLKTVYYFQIDVANFNLNLHPEFFAFMNRQGKISTYLKSASYLLQYPEFSAMKNYILQNSTSILQDDSGIKYADLKTGFNTQLYGKYSRTIKQFTDRYQKDLKKDVDSTSRNLPFLLGYNKWCNETLLIEAYSKRDSSEQNTLVKIKKKNADVKKAKNEIRYKVQIGTVKTMSEKSKYTKIYPNAEYYSENGKIKLTVGNETSYESCLSVRQKAKKDGFKDAFIIAFQNGKRIPIETFMQISKNGD